MDRETKIIAAITAILPISLVLVLAFWIPANLETVVNWAEERRLVAPVLLILWRIIAIVIPPIPGAVVSLALIPVFGWFWSFVWAAVGVLIGETLAFLIARKFREPAAKRFVPLQLLHKWESKLSSQNEFLAFLGIRIATGYIADFLSYAAGLSTLSFTKFIAATLLLLPLHAVVYWAGGKLYEVSEFLAILFIFGGVILFYALQKSKIFSSK